MAGNKIRVIIGSLLFLTTVFASSCSWAITVSDLVDKFVTATDLQRDKMIAECANEKISYKGVVENVKEYGTFDEKVDKGGRYYQVVMEAQKTGANNSYQVSFFYKAADAVKDITRAQEMTANGTVIKIIDERLWISVWIYVGDMGPEDKIMFGEHGMLPKK